MTDISHSYEDLGLLLKDKIAELNTKLFKLQKAQEESSSMMQWLEKMNKTAAKWHQTPTPADTEAVKTQFEQNKVHLGWIRCRHGGEEVHICTRALGSGALC